MAKKTRARQSYNRRAVLIAAGSVIPALAQSKNKDPEAARAIDLGVFSVSLAVKDLNVSKQFYEKLGFKPFAGAASKKYLIMKNGDAIIGLFEGMFEKNILTFNPGWDGNARKKEAYTDIRDLQRNLKASGVEFATQADEATKGPASFMVIDPDGNPILVDQHV